MEIKFGRYATSGKKQIPDLAYGITRIRIPCFSQQVLFGTTTDLQNNWCCLYKFRADAPTNMSAMPCEILWMFIAEKVSCH